MGPDPDWRLRVRLTSLAVLAGVLVGTAAQAAEVWKPDRPVELIALNAPGGGADRILRIMLKFMQERRYVDVPVNVVNKPGGGGSVGYNYLNQHPGDGHYVVLASKALLTNNIVARGPSHSEFTPIALLFTEYVSVTVRPDSTIRSGKDLLEILRKDPGSLSIGIATSLGNVNHQALASAARAAGVDVRRLKTVIFPSGGAATTAMLGGHIDVVPISAAFAGSLVRNKQVRVLAATSPMRLGDVLADVPTWREQGYDVTVSNWRGLVGARGLAEPRVAYWERVMRRLVESDEWKKELEVNAWTSEFLRASDLRALFEKDHAELRTLLADMGLIK